MIPNSYLLILLLQVCFTVLNGQHCQVIKMAAKGDLNKTQEYFQKGDNLNCVDEKFGRNLLHWSIIQAGSIRSKGQGLATHSGWNQLARVLVDKGINVNAYDKAGKNALFYATFYKNDSLASLLMDRNDSPQFNPENLRNAAERGKVDLVRKMLVAGVDPNLANKSGFNALHLAVMNSRVEVCRELIQSKIRLDQPSSQDIGYLSGLSALQLAAIAGDLEIIKLLIDGGADPSIRTKSGLGLIHFAVMGERYESFRPTKNSEYQLMMFKGGYPEAAKFLLSTVKDPFLPDSAGRDPLQWAGYYRRMDMIDLLINQGAKPSETRIDADHLFGSALIHYLYYLKNAGQRDCHPILTKAGQLLQEAKSMYETRREKEQLKITRGYFIKAMTISAAVFATQYQARLYASTSGTGFGYSEIRLPSFKDDDPKEQLKYLKAQIQICDDFSKLIGETNAHQDTEKLRQELLNRINIRQVMSEMH